MSTPYKRLDKNDAAVLLVDHQAGRFVILNRTSSRTTYWRLPTWPSTSSCRPS